MPGPAKFGATPSAVDRITIVDDAKPREEIIQDANVGTNVSQTPSTNGAKSMQNALLEKVKLPSPEPKTKLKAQVLSAVSTKSSIYYERKPELQQLIFETQMEVFAQGLPSNKESLQKLRDSVKKRVKDNFPEKTLQDKFITYIDKKFGDKAEKKHGIEQLMHFRGDEKGAQFLPDDTTQDKDLVRSANLNFFQIQTDQSLGEGRSGHVYRAILVTPGGEQPAAAKDYKDPQHYMTPNELNIVSKLTDSDHVSRIRDSAQLQDRALLFMDFAAHGDCVDVQTAIAAMPDGEDKTNARRSLGRRYVEALAALHAHDPPIRHVDFKPDNLLLTADGRVIVVDFGVSTTGNQFLALKDGNRMGPPTAAYADPLAKSGLRTPEAVDLFALGMTLYGLAKHHLPDEMYELRTTGTRNWDKIDPNWRGFDTTGRGLTGKDLEEVAMMLMDRFSARRPSLEQVLNFPCFQPGGIYTNEELAGLVKDLKTKEA
jgi:hypothetical protein